MDLISRVAALESENLELKSQLQSISTGMSEAKEIAIRNQIASNTNALSHLYMAASTPSTAGTLVVPNL